MADLVVSVSEKITLNGKSQGGTVSKTITGINDCFKRIVTITDVEASLYTTTTATKSGSVFDWDLAKYARITNLDASNGVDIIIKQNSGNAEAGFRLLAGKSFILWDHSADFEAHNTAVTVNAGVSASASLSIADGDEAASGQFTEGEYVKFIALDGTVGIFILSDSSETGAVASGTVLSGSSDLGTGTPSASLLAAGTCVAVTMNLNTCTQALLLNELRDTMGASTSPLLNKVSGAAGTVPSSNGSQALVFTQAVPGAGGNTVTTTNISQLTAPDFTSGVDGAVAGKVQIDAVSAIANTQDCQVEIFIASA